MIAPVVKALLFRKTKGHCVFINWNPNRTVRIPLMPCRTQGELIGI